MAQQVYDLGPVCPIYKGNWSATATYETLNLVRHGTALWVMIAKTYTVGSTPSDSSSWSDGGQVSSLHGVFPDDGSTHQRTLYRHEYGGLSHAQRQLHRGESHSLSECRNNGGISCRQPHLRLRL